MNAAALKNRYTQNTVDTVSPAKLVTMLYDALVKDLVLAEAALNLRDYTEVNARLVKAQEIVMELRVSLDPTKWDGAQSLIGLYTFLFTELVQANVKKDAHRVAACRKLIEPLRDAWHEAAVQLVG